MDSCNAGVNEDSECVGDFLRCHNSNITAACDPGRACQTRDLKQTEKFTEWLRVHSPFDKPGDVLVSLSSGVVGDDTVNCDLALEVGTSTIKKLEGKSFADIKLQRKDKVIPLAAMSNIVIVEGETISVNPN